jgi:hypothetical protein
MLALVGVTILIAARPSKLAIWVCLPGTVSWSLSRCDRLCVSLRYLVWLLLTVELSIFHSPSSATSP